MAWVSASLLTIYIYLTCLTVDHLLEKHQLTVLHLADTQVYLQSVETSIGDPALVFKWWQEHDKWEADVVNITNHCRMKNPFEIATGAGTLLAHVVSTLLSMYHSIDHKDDCNPAE